MLTLCPGLLGGFPHLFLPPPLPPPPGLLGEVMSSPNALPQTEGLEVASFQAQRPKHPARRGHSSWWRQQWPAQEPHPSERGKKRTELNKPSLGSLPPITPPAPRCLTVRPLQPKPSLQVRAAAAWDGQAARRFCSAHIAQVPRLHSFPFAAVESIELEAGHPGGEGGRTRGLGEKGSRAVV